MASMNRVASKSAETPPPKSKAIAGLPTISYYPPLIATLGATLFVLLVMLLLTVIAIGDTVAQLSGPASADDSGPSGAGLFCGILAIVGIIVTAYFAFALSKGVRDLFTPVQYTRGSLADKRVIAGRFVGNWIGVVPSYVGPDLGRSSFVTDEEAAASADRTRIVQTRNGPGLNNPERKRGGYLSPGRISSTLVTDPLVPEKPESRRIFRADPAAYESLRPGEQVLVAHSRFLEHIYYIAHLRDGEWESFRNRSLI